MKKPTWTDDIIEALNNLGGEAHYSNLYPEVKNVRLKKGASWPKKAHASVRGRIEENSDHSRSFKKRRNIFYNSGGLGSGIWGLMPEYKKDFLPILQNEQNEPLYHSGMEGIARERTYLSRSRNSKLVKARKELDKYTCQCCLYKKEVSGKYIIDVHHLNPLGRVEDFVKTKIEDLICLCPNCHRIAHSNKNFPLPIDEIKKILKNPA